MFRKVLNLKQNVRPPSVLIGYGLAVKTALEAVFPGVDVKGCFFHFTQSMLKKLQDNGLQGRYQVDSNFVLEARMIAGGYYKSRCNFMKIYFSRYCKIFFKCVAK